MSTKSPDFEIFGVGCGPANLGVAIALEEIAGPDLARNSLFVDKKPNFDWHPDMLLDSSVMQISFLKDLVTQRNPNSSFSFLSYLKHHDRLSDFINKQSFFPSRREFTDYLSWCCSRITCQVRFDSKVISVSVDPSTGFNIVTWIQNGSEHVSTARYVVFGMGSSPDLPSWTDGLNTRVIHNSSLVSGARSTIGDYDARARVAVVGQGQSAAESIRHILEKYPNCSVDTFWSGYGMVPADNSPFANRIFDPEAVDDFYFAPASVRQSLIRRHKHTNYSCVDIDLIRWLYDFEYEEMVSGSNRLRIHRAHHILDVRSREESVELDVVDTLNGEEVLHSVDLCICATGFSADYPRDIVGSVEGDSFYSKRDYRIVLNDVEMPWFAVGISDTPHGLSAGLLSNISVRSGELVKSISPSLCG